MSVDFGSLIPQEERIALIKERIKSFASEGWQHELNKLSFEANKAAYLEEDNAEMVALMDEAIAKTDDAIVKVSRAIELHQAELAILEG